MKRKYVITLISAFVMILLSMLIHYLTKTDMNDRIVKVGFVYVGDASTAYTGNFIKAQNEIAARYGDRVEIIAQYNVMEGNEEPILQKLVDEGCGIIFATSYGYSNTVKEMAKKYPEIEFCQATGDNANSDEVLSNYHTYMGHIHEGRYVSGVIAGRKLKELIDSGIIQPADAKIGYVGAYPYAEVISGYTAFLLGVRSVVPQATMVVKYADTWSNYSVEKEIAKELIDEGCVIISQHSDTEGPAVACEEAPDKTTVFHVGYNISMMDVAPTTSLVSTRINWEPYMVAAVGAVLEGKPIEKVVECSINGNDAGAGFRENWVEIIGINDVILPFGTKELAEDIIKEFKHGRIDVFKGDYQGTNPYDSADTISLINGYPECAKASAPSFGYVLDDIITIEE